MNRLSIADGNYALLPALPQGRSTIGDCSRAELAVSSAYGQRIYLPSL
jgi:hypothetical protein